MGRFSYWLDSFAIQLLPSPRQLFHAAETRSWRGEIDVATWGKAQRLDTWPVNIHCDQGVRSADFDST